MNVTIRPGQRKGRIQAPPSKSYAHRLLLSAALTGAGACIDGVDVSGDISATLACIRSLGGEYTAENGSVCILRPMTGEGSGILPCHESGSTLRFFLPVALALRGEAIFTGTRRLMERGAELYEELLAPLGVTFEKSEESITVRGTLSPGDYSLRGDVSSQYVTGLLLALPLLPGESTLRIVPPVESRPYVDITLDVLRKSGIVVRETGENCFSIPGDQHYSLRHGTIEGDWSNGAFWYALQALGYPVEVTGLDPNSVQGDRLCPELLARLRTPDAVVDLRQNPDLGPLLFAAAACLCGAEFTGIRRLRTKESDRVLSMAQELRKCGVAVTAEDDRVVIRTDGLHNSEEPLSGHNDHRVVMALALLCTVIGGTITGAEAVGKSYPGFFEDLASLCIVTGEE